MKCYKIFSKFLPEFWSKIRFFFFCTKLCIWKNLRMLDWFARFDLHDFLHFNKSESNYLQKLFSDFSREISRKDISRRKFKDFYFWTKLCVLANSSVLVLNMTMVVKIRAQKWSSKASLVSNLRTFIFALEFAPRQIWGFWFWIWR